MLFEAAVKRKKRGRYTAFFIRIGIHANDFDPFGTFGDLRRLTLPFGRVNRGAFA